MFHFSENLHREDFYPITLTRPVADIRVGILTIREKWMHSGLSITNDIDPSIIPNLGFFSAVSTFGYAKAIEDSSLYERVQYPWDLPAKLGKAIADDLELMGPSILKQELPAHAAVTGDKDLVVLEQGAQLEHCFINVTGGPVHIAAGAVIMEGAMLRGPVSIGKGTVVKMGAAIYGSSIGPGCLIGGEVKGSVFIGNSNKAHDGYIGDAVIGEWCNLGAGTSCSNIRNTATPVKAWHMKRREYMTAGLKCGLIMGDHSRASINTSFNTGTVVGVSANVFQPGQLTPKYIPSFSWGMHGDERYRFDKAIEDIRNWMAFKNSAPDNNMIENLKVIFNNQL